MAALNLDDRQQVDELIAAVERQPDAPPYLLQWCTYARHYPAQKAGQIDRAIELLDGLRRMGADNLAPRLWPKVLNGLGIIYDLNEQWDQALGFYLQSYDYYTAQNDCYGMISALNNLSGIYDKSGELADALDCARRGVALALELPLNEANQVVVSRAWNSLGNVYKSAGNLTQACDAFASSLVLAQSNADLDGEGVAHHNLGEIYQAWERYAEAQSYYQAALELLDTCGDDYLAADSLHGLARCRMLAGEQSPELLQSFDQALQRAAAAHNQEIITDILLSRAECHERLGDLPAAIADSRLAVQESESLQLNLGQPDEMARFLASRSAAYDALVTRLQRSYNGGQRQSFGVVEMAKSRALLDQLGRRFVIRPSEKVPPDLQTEERRLRQEWLVLQQQDDGSAAAAQAIADLEQALQQTRERIRLLDAEFGSFQSVQPLSLAEAQNCLPDGALLLEYFIAGDYILAYAVTARHFRSLRLDLRVTELQRAFKPLGGGQFGMLCNLTPASDGRLYSPYLLRNLYQRLVKPFAAELAAAQLLCIVPHGLLHYLPFHAFYEDNGQGKRYLTETGDGLRPVLYAPSASVLLDYCQNKPLSRHSGCLALGYDQQGLTQAEAEAQAVVQILGGQARLGPAATRSALLEDGAAYRYVHISSHGDFHPRHPTLSGLNLADGRLDVTDVLRDCRLNADLVCLSACETGRHSILRGDELIGLTRAFLYAGTPAVLVSHWRVDEFSTRLLMETFYSCLLNCQGQPGAAALALTQAQRALRCLSMDELHQEIDRRSLPGPDLTAALQRIALARGAPSIEALPGDVRPFDHPYYWAPFFLVGDRLTAAAPGLPNA